MKKENFKFILIGALLTCIICILILSWKGHVGKIDNRLFVFEDEIPWPSETIDQIFSVSSTDNKKFQNTVVDTQNGLFNTKWNIYWRTEEYKGNMYWTSLDFMRTEICAVKMEGYEGSGMLNYSLVTTVPINCIFYSTKLENSKIAILGTETKSGLFTVNKLNYNINIIPVDKGQIEPGICIYKVKEIDVINKKGRFRQEGFPSYAEYYLVANKKIGDIPPDDILKEYEFDEINRIKFKKSQYVYNLQDNQDYVEVALDLDMYDFDEYEALKDKWNIKYTLGYKIYYNNKLIDDVNSELLCPVLHNNKEEYLRKMKLLDPNIKKIYYGATGRRNRSSVAIVTMYVTTYDKKPLEQSTEEKMKQILKQTINYEIVTFVYNKQ